MSFEPAADRWTRGSSWHFDPCDSAPRASLARGFGSGRCGGLLAAFRSRSMRAAITTISGCRSWHRARRCCRGSKRSRSPTNAGVSSPTGIAARCRRRQHRTSSRSWRRSPGRPISRSAVTARTIAAATDPCCAYCWRGRRRESDRRVCKRRSMVNAKSAGRKNAAARRKTATKTTGAKKRTIARKVETVEEYLARVTPGQRAALEALRTVIRSAAPHAEEGISYQLPAFRLNGPLVAYGASASHCAFYLMSGTTVQAHAKDLQGFDTSKGTIRFREDDPLPSALVRKLVKARIHENTARAKGSTKSARAPRTPRRGMKAAAR